MCSVVVVVVVVVPLFRCSVVPLFLFSQIDAS